MSHLTQVLAQMGYSVGMVVLGELLVTGVDLRATCARLQLEDLIWIRRFGGGGVLRLGSLSPCALLAVFHNPPECQPENQEIVDSPEWTKDVGDEVKWKNKIYESEYKSGFRGLKEFHRERE